MALTGSLTAHLPRPEDIPDTDRIGPYAMPLGGTLEGYQTTHITEVTTCTARLRGDKHGVRQLKVVGDASQTRKAYQMAIDYIDLNGLSEGRATPYQQLVHMNKQQAQAYKKT